MTKQNEIDLVRELAAKLGRHSYCGPWLEAVADEVLAEMRSDFMPSPSIAKAQKEADDIRAAAKSEAEGLVRAARKVADDIRAERVRRLNVEIQETIRALEAAKFSIA